MGKDIQSQQAESYMNGWRAGYHNATLAERERILKLIHNNTRDQDRQKLVLLINQRESNDRAR